MAQQTVQNVQGVSSVSQAGWRVAWNVATGKLILGGRHIDAPTRTRMGLASFDTQEEAEAFILQQGLTN